MKISGGVTITGGPTIFDHPAVAVDGDLTFTFPDPPKPAILRADGVVKVVGIPLANAYFEFRTDGYVGWGGGLDYRAGFFSLTSRLDGWLKGPKFNVESTARVCVAELKCEGGQVVISSVGFGGCVQTFLADFGGGYKWGGSLDIMLHGCDVGEFRAVASGAGSQRTFSFDGNPPSGFVGVRGKDGPPHVALVDPNGKRIEAPASGPLETRDAIVFHVPEQKITWFVLGKPAAGQWHVEELPGSTPVTGVSVANGLPKPSIKATVKPHGKQRELDYEITPLPGQQVVFAEQGTNAAAELGKARGTKGKIVFTPTGGPGGKRKIVANVTSNGVPRTSLAVATYTAPKPAVPAKPKIKAARKGSKLVVTWQPSANAGRYRVTVKLSDGRTLLFVQAPNKRSVTVTGVDKKATGQVSVEAIRADGLASRAATVKIKKSS